ncbi:MAG: hypothetical protein NVS3B10_27880 [Polyangiales bacterium]
MPIVRRFRHWVRRLFSASPLLLAALAACASPMTPAAKLNDVVQETNLALRFGRNDVAIEHVIAKARSQFIAHHRTWGSELRIADVELGAVEKMTEKEAIVLVGFSWFRPAEGTLRTTVVRQTWKNDEGSGPWGLFAEERVSGDIGLLGEATVKVLVPEAKAVHFGTVTIPGN